MESVQHKQTDRIMGKGPVEDSDDRSGWEWVETTEGGRFVNRMHCLKLSEKNVIKTMVKGSEETLLQSYA